MTRSGTGDSEMPPRQRLARDYPELAEQAGPMDSQEIALFIDRLEAQKAMSKGGNGS